jgi:hypothetical protein
MVGDSLNNGISIAMGKFQQWLKCMIDLVLGKIKVNVFYGQALEMRLHHEPLFDLRN